MTSPPPEVRRVRWAQACRIVPTRHPTITLFDRVADAADFDALYALEALTNERVRDELGTIERVPKDQRVYGPGSGPIMAAFTHVNTEKALDVVGAPTDPNAPKKRRERTAPPPTGRRDIKLANLPVVRVELVDPELDGKAERIGTDSTSRVGY